MVKMTSQKTKEPVWLENLRQSSSAKLNKIGYPGKKQEDWKYTNMEEILNSSFKTSDLHFMQGTLKNDLDDDFPGDKYYCHFFAREDNQMDEASSDVVSKPDRRQILLMSIKEAILADHRLLRDYLDITSFQEKKHPIFLENTSLFQNGLLLNVSPETPIDKPIYLKFQMRENKKRKEEKHAYYIRNLIIVEEGASLELLEDYTSLYDSTHLIQVVNEIILKPDSNFRHTKLQRQGDSSYHLSLNRILQYKRSHYKNDLLMTGSHLARNEVQLRILDEDCISHLNGIYIGDGEQSLDQIVSVEHVKPNASSSQVYRGILQGESNAAFQGEIHVHPHGPENQSPSIQQDPSTL